MDTSVNDFSLFKLKLLSWVVEDFFLQMEIIEEEFSFGSGITIGREGSSKIYWEKSDPLGEE